MSRRDDLTGRTYGRLTVIKPAKIQNGTTYYICKCGCPKHTEVIVSSVHLKSGHTKSCGCYKSEMVSKRCLDNLVGRRFGRLTVLSRVYNPNRTSPSWTCRCDCGKEVVATSDELKAGDTRSCGCLRRKYATEYDSRIAHIWRSMMDRCYNKDRRDYTNWGARGVTVCDEWHDVFKFIEWTKTHGYRPGLTIERRDNSGAYCPENCYWATKKQQANNRRTSHYIIVDDTKMTIMQWAEELNLSRPKALRWYNYTDNIIAQDIMGYLMEIAYKIGVDAHAIRVSELLEKYRTFKQETATN